jgi:asparagine synthase (glutamine-hydrolysing)
MLMSALAGIFAFDPRDRINDKEFTELAHGIDRIGPDGGTEYLTQGLGMAYRAFHTTPESHCETQPLVRDGSILTWDGRLDNREEICTKLGRRIEEAPTDLELVFEAYQKWGTRCFPELTGDWALALWDQATHQLILARDYIGIRRLFYRVDHRSVVWCTAIEPLVLTSSWKLHLDIDYIAGCFYPRPPVEATPYREIRSVIPASFLAFQYGGGQRTVNYWSLNPHASIRYSKDSEYEAHFLNVFRKSVSLRLRADRTILAELSGGIDSSSIVCMADDIGSRCRRPVVETLSYYDTDEPSGDERPFFTLLEKRRSRTGHHVSISDFRRLTAAEALAPLPDELFVASPGCTQRSLCWDSTIAQIQTQTGARIILSGLGGDEVLGGVQNEAPELAEHLLAGRLTSLARSALHWSLAKRKTFYALLFNAFELIGASHRPEALIPGSVHPLDWVRLGSSTAHPALRTFARWPELDPLQLCMEAIRYSLAQQLTCTDPPLVGCTERRYPYLDRSLYVFLASIPRTQVLQAGCRRHLMRRALCGLVPDEVLFRKTKWFGTRGPAANLTGQQEALDNMFADKWVSDGVIVDTAILREHLAAVQHGALNEGLSIRSSIGVEQWLRTQMRRGILDLTSGD